jgi:hypothetical protein
MRERGVVLGEHESSSLIQSSNGCSVAIPRAGDSGALLASFILGAEKNSYRVDSELFSVFITMRQL